ncbi:MAG: hypothetical protein EA417_10360 [Gammaproteobacteria bacterium]|nr:MAG: hypothetical protein EA417_10360 [Gammaproteobacteria bacterium]
MMTGLGMLRDAAAVARHYGALLDGFMLDSSDAPRLTEVEALSLQAVATPTLMVTLHDKMNLALTTLDFVASISKRAIH